MAKNLDQTVQILNLREYEIEKINELLDKGKTLIVAVERGSSVSESLKNGYSTFLKANIELKEERENCGTCGCGKPANILVYVWR